MMRRYAGKWHRFTQPDPYDGAYDLTDPQSFNRYAYVQNDPVNFVDPTAFLPIAVNLAHEINYHWHAAWQGDLLNDKDSLEDVEIVIRMEEAFGISIPDRDAQQFHTVAGTVRYLWQRLSSISPYNANELS